MKYTPAFAFTLIVLTPIYAHGAAVYSGCAVPSLTSTHHTFYVDPVHGNLSGDGSAAKPWSTLADVLNPANKLISTQGHAGSKYGRGIDTALHPVNPTGPVKSGDVILLKSGNHGSPTVTNMYNDDFITVAAAPGATPVVSKLALVSSGKWMFQGITFEGMASTATGAKSAASSSAGLVTAGRGDWEGQTTDIVFSGDVFRTASSTSGWTNYDWLNKPYNMSVWIFAPCVSVTDSHVYNILNGIVVSGQKSLVQGNTVEMFANDAMDLTTSNLLIKSNTIKNGVNTIADNAHADGIQGWSTISKGVPILNTNVVVDGNILTKTGNATVTYMQGISIFDGKWDGLIIQNNVVDVNHWNAVAVYGATNSKILNNTVIAADPTAHPSWIQVTKAKDGTASSNVLVRNNIATQMLIDGKSIEVDHNIAADKIVMPVNGTATTITTGTVGTANSVLPAVLTGFVGLNTTAGKFDMRLLSTSVAVGFGTLTGAPALDLIGKGRTAPVDAGAYVH